jgi:hypothetical protein
MPTVDSRKRKLNTAEIVVEGLKNTKSKYPPQQAIPAILAELGQPNCKSIQIGNTLFIVHVGEDGKGFFKALNADIPDNFINNSRQFCVWAKKQLGLSFLVTEFNGKEIEIIAKSISRNPPMPGMGFQTFKMKSGAMRLVLLLEPMKG